MARVRPAFAIPRRARGFAVVLVLMVIALASVMLVSLQSSAWRDAAAGRHAVAEVRAKWAARAGVEATIARLAQDTLQSQLTDIRTLQSELAAVSTGQLAGATYSIRHWHDGQEREGPADAHAKININTATFESFMLLSGMTEDVAQAILDWVDADEDPQPLGAEAGTYLSARIPYLPRNAPFRTIQELELVAGVRPELVRGEDWNLNGRLDPEENDGPGGVFPPGNGDGVLDAGWSAILTAAPTGVGMAHSGQKRLDLSTATAAEIATRLGVDNTQAEAIATYAATEGATLAAFLRQDLAALAPQDTATPTGTARRFAQAQAGPAPLSDDQLIALFAEAQIGQPEPDVPGKLNINTCAAEALEYLPGLSPGLADSIIYEREARSGGFTSIIDLLAVPAMTRETLADLVDLIDVRSNVYIITSRGRDSSTGVEVEIRATVDRSTLPIVIKDQIIR